MGSTNWIWFMVLLLPGTVRAGEMPCHLPDVSTQGASTLLSTASEATKRVYRDYFDTLLILARKNDVLELDRCCASVSQPTVTRSVCSLLSYIAEKKKNPKRFLQNTPREKDEVNWLWLWDALLLSESNQKITAEFPSGIAAYYIEQVYSLIDTEPSLALDRLLGLDRYSDGEYAQYISEKLLTLFKDRPHVVIFYWPQIRSHRSSIDKMVELYAHEMPRLQRTVGQACATAKAETSCAEILQLLRP